MSHQVLHLLSKTHDLTLNQIYALSTARRGPTEQGKSLNTNCWETKKNSPKKLLEKVTFKEKQSGAGSLL